MTTAEAQDEQAQDASAGEGVLSPGYLATTIGTFSLIVFIAFESLAVTTVMPTISRELDGEALYALGFAGPLASGVIGMVAAGGWSDRRGPRRAVQVALLTFVVGLLVCGLAPTMEVFVLGRVVQGLGGGALMSSLYVVVGEVFPEALRPSIFASFAAAWVLPSLFGPAVAAFVAHALGWRWVFLLVVALVLGCGLLVSPALRRLRARDEPGRADARRLLAWSVLAAAAVLAVELLGSIDGPLAITALLPLLLVGVAVRPLLPPGTLRAARGLPAVMVTRGALAAAFFCAEAYVVFVLQERWGYSPGQAGIALSIVGVVWAAASQAQARVRLSNTRTMTIGTTLVLAGLVVLAASVAGTIHPLLAMAGYGLGGAGMGFAYARTGVSMLAGSTDADRGFNSSALTISDSLGGALALAVSGVVYASVRRADGDPFTSVFALAAALAVVAVLAARRTRPVRG